MARPATVDNGDTLILNCTASGGPNNTFRWSKDGGDIAGSTDGILNIADVTTTDGGSYECVVNNTASNSSANITIYGRTYISHDNTVCSIMFLYSCSTVHYRATR